MIRWGCNAATILRTTSARMRSVTGSNPGGLTPSIRALPPAGQELSPDCAMLFCDTDSSNAARKGENPRGYLTHIPQYSTLRRWKPV